MRRNSRRKYGNITYTVEGKNFHSKKEGLRYAALRLLERNGVISDLKCQVRFKLWVKDGVPVLNENGTQITYVLDFSYWCNETDQAKYEDVKGEDTKLSELKRGVVKAYYKIEIDLV